VNASWQVEGVLFPGRIIQLPGGQLYARRSGKQIGDRRGAAAAARCGSGGGGGGSSRSRTKRPAWIQSGLDKEPCKRVIPRQRVCQRAAASL